MSKHLSIDEFVSVKDDPDSADDRVIDHLVQCLQCKAKIASVDRCFHSQAVSFENESPINVNDNVFNITNPGLAAWPENKFAQHQLLTKLLLMNDSPIASSRLSPGLTSKKSMPVWAIAAGFAVSFIIGGWMFAQNSTPSMVAVYQDADGVAVIDKTPGIGFFDDMVMNKIAVTAVNMSLLNENQLKFEWPDFANESPYELNIVDQKMKRIFSQKVTDNTIMLDASQFHFNINYQWKLKHIDKTGSTFTLSGGFVLGKK